MTNGDTVGPKISTFAVANSLMRLVWSGDTIPENFALLQWSIWQLVAELRQHRLRLGVCSCLDSSQDRGWMRFPSDGRFVS